MKRISQLHTFLAQESAKGQTVSQGGFTISSEHALRKLSSHALPFDSAWVLKLVQAGSAAGCKSIKILLYPACTEVEFEGECPWLIDDLSHQLQTMESSPISGLDHLNAALRNRLKPDREWVFFPAGSCDVLYWNGQEIRKVENELRATKTVISVQTAAATSVTTANLGIRASQNALLAQIIFDNAHLCPVPLYVDSRRVDRLSHLVQNKNEYDVVVCQGWLKEDSSHSLCLSGENQPLANNPLPRALQTYETKLLQGRRCGIPWLVRASFFSEGFSKPERSGFAWKAGKAPSTLNFVKDGILVDQVPLHSYTEHVSFHLFLNAAGLRSDISGFTLVDNADRQQSMDFAREKAKEVLSELTKLSLPEPSDFPDESLGERLLRFFGALDHQVLSAPAEQLNEIQSSFQRLRQVLLADLELF